MLEFIEKLFWIIKCLHSRRFRGITILSYEMHMKRKKLVSSNNWPCQARPAFVSINSNQPLYDLFTVSFNKYGGGSCNISDDPYASVIYVQDESRECKCEFNESVCNSKQKWYHDECWYECKELDNWSYCKTNTCRTLVRVIANVIMYL